MSFTTWQEKSAGVNRRIPSLSVCTSKAQRRLTEYDKLGGVALSPALQIGVRCMKRRTSVCG
jgi:hypothetical protein